MGDGRGAGVAAIVVAGGSSARMGHDKAALLLEGATLLQRTVDACARLGPVVVVAPVQRRDLLRPDTEVHWTLEDPPGGGPVAGIAAGLTALVGPASATLHDPGAAEFGPGQTVGRVGAVQVLPVDVPGAGAILDALAAAPWPDDSDALVPVDSAGWPQWLMGRYRLDPLRRAVAGLGGADGRSVRRLFQGWEPTLVAVPDRVLNDVDDPAAAMAAGLRPAGDW